MNKAKTDWIFLKDTINCFDDLSIIHIIESDIMFLNDAFIGYFDIPIQAEYTISELKNYLGEENFTSIFEDLKEEVQQIAAYFNNTNHRFTRTCKKINHINGDYYLHKYQPLVFASANAKLNTSKFLQLVMDNIPQRIFWKDKESVYLGCNQNFANAAGVKTPSNIIGKTDYDLVWTDEQTEFFRRVDREVMDTNKQRLNIITKISPADSKSGWARSNKVPLSDENKIIGILGTYEDITELKEKEKLILNQFEILNEQKKELESFAYAASHDMKTPLRTIISFSQLLYRSIKDRIMPREKEYLDFIISATKNLSELIDGILKYSSLNHEIETKEIDIIELLSYLFMELDSAVQETGAEFNILFSESIIVADNFSIKQLFQNLILNSLKFKKPDVRPIININFKDLGDFWQFSIADNGIGIEEVYKDRIFKMFQRLHTNDQYEGTGIGLALCEKIVNIHKGKIWLESEYGIGTTFHFTIAKQF